VDDNEIVLSLKQMDRLKMAYHAKRLGILNKCVSKLMKGTFVYVIGALITIN
jgi:hypothetical protein